MLEIAKRTTVKITLIIRDFQSKVFRNIFYGKSISVKFYETLLNNNPQCVDQKYQWDLCLQKLVFWSCSLLTLSNSHKDNIGTIYKQKFVQCYKNKQSLKQQKITTDVFRQK